MALLVLEKEEKFYVVDAANFKRMSVNQTYARHGQKISKGDEPYRLVTAMNFFNGNNWETIVTADPYAPCLDYKKASCALRARVLKAFEKKEFIKDEKGIKSYGYKDATIYVSAWAGAWYSAKVEL